MDNSTRELLVKRIEDEFENLYSMEDGEDKQKAINNLVTLYKLKIEEEKIYAEYHEHCDKCDLGKAQLEEQKLDRWVNLGMQVGLAMLSIVAYDIWNRRGLKFEETGTITSPMTRNLLSKMLPKR